MSAQTTDQPKTLKSDKPKSRGFKDKKKILIIAIPVVVLILAFLPNLTARAFYAGRNMPNTSVSGVDVSGKNKQQTEQIVKNSYNNKKITFKFKGQQEQGSYQDIGLNYDYDATFGQSLTAHRNGLGDIVFFWRGVDIEPKYSINADQLNQYIISKYGQSEAPQNAEITFSDDQNQFIVTPEKSGYGVSSNKASQQISKISRSQDNPSIDLVEEEVKPEIKADQLTKLQTEANQTINPELTVSWLGSSQTIAPSVKKDWVKLKDDQGAYLQTTQVDGQAAKNYINDAVSKIKQDAVPKEVISVSGSSIVLSEGQDGFEVSNPERYATQLSDAFSGRQPLNLNIEVKKIDRPVKDYAATGGRWLYADLSDFKMIAYEGANPVRTFSISSGAARFPTVTGNYKVYAKIRSQTMKGGDGSAANPIYEVPNVEWISYFYKDYGIHGVYWHNNFGIKNSSHGCIGITNSDAQWIYNWDSIGTPVIVRP